MLATAGHCWANMALLCTQQVPDPRSTSKRPRPVHQHRIGARKSHLPQKRDPNEQTYKPRAGTIYNSDRLDIELIESPYGRPPR
jgi:hypothetical protein